MFTIVAAALIPLILIITAGAFAYRLSILPENTASVLNGFVYYFTLPALLFYSMATTPFHDIMQLRFICGYFSAIILTYSCMFMFSQFVFKARYTESNMRATTGSFGNSAYLGLPIMLYLFDGSKQSLIITTLAIILPSGLMILTVAVFQLNRTEKSGTFLSTISNIIASLLKTPMITSAFAGALFSYFGLELPNFLSNSLKNFGMASVPCALFAVGILIVKLKVKFQFREMAAVSVCKLLIHPLLAGVLLSALSVEKQTVLMGILLAGLPPATLVSVLAESYKTCDAETAVTLLLSTFLYIPALYFTLHISSSLGFHL